MTIANQLNTATTSISVAEGGTGVATMTTAYSPVCAGTTATGSLQVASTGLGTSGFVLTSNGSSALPSFQATATVSGSAKFWIKANGAGTTINASFNVTSITDVGTGDITVTIATDFSSANWCGTACNVSGLAQMTNFQSVAAGSCTVINQTTITAVDPTSYFIAGFGDQ